MRTRNKMKGIYTMIALLVFAAAFSTDVLAQKRDRNGVGAGRTTQTNSLGSKKGVTSDWNGDGKDTVGIAVDPRDSTGNTYYVGSANGGVWKTTNARYRSINQTPTIGGSRQVKDGTSNTIMFNRVATGDVTGDSLVATTYGRGAQRRIVQGNYIGTNAVGTYSTNVGPNVRKK